ncbi:hypothetical protein PENPOL_c005G03423 [Penicillium polonicum]|uniref:Uncharacterized protein n=1 Tax=Penicillium polonicum TaxID=60169 RepID=A0A1V6NMF3_PENPO|nr:hypothetical protein PENPOL_c005G03423 [Penicillium polonicum]
MPALANSPKAWKSWWDQLYKLSTARDISTTELKQFIKDPPVKPELPQLAAADMTPTDVNMSFGLSEVQGYETWQFPRPLVLIRPEFETWLDMILKPAEGPLLAKIDVLLFRICMNVKTKGFLDGLKVTRTHHIDTSLEWGPITYDTKQYKCVGTADCSIFLGERDHMACHLIALDANHNHQGQLLAYMAMARAKRKADGEPDSTVWGVLTDGQWFYFSRLNNEGRWSIVAYRVRRDGWRDIVNVMAYMVLQAHWTTASAALR